MTNNLETRIIEHYLNRGQPKTFAGKYFCYNLLFWERFQYVQHAIDREKEIKGWKAAKKLALIKTINPHLKFLNLEILGQWPPEDGVESRNFYG